VIISAYDDFAYARNAMAFGVENYILKPIDDKKIEEITHLLKQINDTSRKRTARITSFFNSSIITDLSNAVNEGNIRRVETLIREAMNLDGADFRSVMDLGTNLLAALYRHSVDIGMSPVVDGRALSESLAILQAQHSAGAVYTFVCEQYRWVCAYLARNKNPNKQAVVEKVKRYIEASFADAEITTYSIARKFHISQSYLCQIYREIEKTSINTLITELRINQACQLIATSEMPLQEISRKVGYPDPHYFAKVFRKIKGMAPSDYKEITRQHE
jgi:two-component system, response regulator YesN